MEFQIWSLAWNVISRFSDVVPEFVLKTVGVKLSFLSKLWENLLFDHAKSFWNTINHLLVQNVHASVNFVTDELLWLLDETCDSVLLICYDDSKSAGIFDCGQHDWSHFIVALVKLEQFLEWVFAKHVAIENKEDVSWVIAVDYFFSQSQWSRCTQSILLFWVCDLYFVFISEKL